MYYLVLVVYASIYATELISGGEAAEALRSNLANDHAAVASGDALRLFTSAFVTTSVRQLGVTLLCLFTVGSELEALLGSGVYWALLCLSVLAGGFADAALGGLPITSGPAPIVAGVVSALLAVHVKNWHVEAQLQQLQEVRDGAAGGSVPSSAPSLERQRLRAMLFDLAGPPPRLGGSAASSLDGADQQQQQEAEGGERAGTAAAAGGIYAGSSGSSSGSFQSASLAGPELHETKLEILEGLWAPTVLLPREGKAFVTLAGLATASVSAVMEAADASEYTAIIFSFVAGGALGALLAPRWRVEWHAAFAGGDDSGADGSLRGGKALPGSVDGGEEEGEVLYWRPALVDGVTGRRRANTIVGAAALLYASLGVWLLFEI